jgi:hypothetical protein
MLNQLLIAHNIQLLWLAIMLNHTLPYVLPLVARVKLPFLIIALKNHYCYANNY